MKLGSLFDGSGGFPLAASMCGIEPMWAAEIEPYPIAVTCSRFPNMKHLGSVTDVKGNEVEPVDVITFGSPCQDLSVAGKRAGLKHTENGDEETTRSGLFMEAIRIIKEMREATNGVYPRFAVWENVPGAFSSNKGEDFRIVLEEFVKVVEPTAVMPTVPKNGWPYADSYCGDGWSISYRVFDAQFWGVPQRRRRIYLVADFRGQRAGKVSFEREGLRGYFAESGAQREEVAGDVENCSGTANREGERVIPYTLKIRSGCAVDSAGKAAGKGALIQENKAATLAVAQDRYLFQPIAVATQQGGAEITENGICPTVTAAAGMSGNNQPWVAYPDDCILDDQGGSQISVRTDGKSGAGADDRAGGCIGFHLLQDPISIAEKTPCLSSGNPVNGQASVGVVFRLDQQGGKGGANFTENVMPTLCSDSHATPHAVAYPEAVGFDGYNSADTGDHERRITDYTSIVCKQKIGTFQNTGVGWWNETPIGATIRTPCGGDSTMANVVVKEEGIPVRYIVRRLTPTECARLQGFADRWGDIDEKEILTPEEFQFWHEVRNTHAAINGKKVMEYTEAQMLTWYNKLHTDSAEYKLWGNGIALPCALYVLEGIAEVFKED